MVLLQLYFDSFDCMVDGGFVVFVDDLELVLVASDLKGVGE